MARYLIHGIKVPLDFNMENLAVPTAAALGVPPQRLGECHLLKRSLDARKKGKLAFVLQVEVALEETLKTPLPAQVRLLETSRYHLPKPAFLNMNRHWPENKPPVIVVGAGPAGMFAALGLIEAGIPTILLERGKPVETRMRDIGQLRSHGDLNPESNVCFGEGGAGAYTDGKLYTRIKSPLVPWVMRRFVDFGAPNDILVDAHPHLGTDKLVRIVKTMRQHLIDTGTDVRFETKVQALHMENARVAGVVLEDGSVLQASAVILAIGHSARDTLATLVDQGVAIEPKPFAVGVRVEHPQELINQAQYGKADLAKQLGAAAYQLTYQAEDSHLEKRGVYSFCMCPGGFIVPSPTEPDRMAINGMSNANRSAPFANSGVVVQVTPEDLERVGYKRSPLMGIAFQRSLEEKTFEATDKPYAAPAMRIIDFIKRKPSGTLAPTHFRPAAEPYDIHRILPAWIAKPLRKALIHFDSKIRGYAGSDGNMLAVESRTSSPVRITRADDLQSVDVAGLYPVGEGAGYAGGIVSAAVDGLRAAAVIAEDNS